MEISTFSIQALYKHPNSTAGTISILLNHYQLTQADIKEFEEIKKALIILSTGSVSEKYPEFHSEFKNRIKNWDLKESWNPL